MATPTHVRAIDEIEGAPSSEGHTLRVALEVADTAAAVAASAADGRELLSPPTTTPFRTINARISGPAGWQVTFFQELETLAEREQRPGFSTDDRRA